MKPLCISGFSDEVAPDFDSQLAAMREFGVKYIELRGADEINVSDFTPDKTREIKAKLNAAGVRVSSIGSPIGKINIDQPFQPHLEKLKRTLEIQKELDAPYLRMFSFYMPKGKDPEDFHGEVTGRIEAMVREGEKWNSVLLHENEKGIYGDNACRCERLCSQFFGEHFQAVFDFSNFVEVGQDTLEAYRLLKPYITYIHVKDCRSDSRQVVPAGQGDGHIQEILEDLIGGDWRGFLSLEPHLTDFTGLADLEQQVQKRGGELKGKDAWKLALDSLREILSRIPQAREALI